MIPKALKALFCAGLAVSLVMTSGSNPALFAAKASADSGASKRASKALLEGVRDFLKDVTEYQSLKTDEEKVQYLLTKGTERIVAKSGELAWDRLKKEMANVAAAKMREAMFKEKVPAMMHQVLVEKMTTSAAWSAANAELVSKIDTRLNALKTGITSAKVAVKGLTEWRKTGDLRKGFEAFGKAAADEVLEYLVPGWKLYRVAQGIVEALGAYIMSEAFTSALEGNVRDVLPFPPESNPKAFAEWIQTTDLKAHVENEWNDYIGSNTRLYARYDGNSETHEEAGDEMKAAILATLEKMKANVLEEKRKMEAIEREFAEKIRELEQKSDAANKEARSALESVFAQADPYLKMIEDYKTNLYGNQKKDLESGISEVESEMNAVKTSIAYTPIAAGTILSDLEAAYSEITDNYSSGYDYKKAQELWNYYVESRKKVIAENDKQFSDLAAQLKPDMDPGAQNRITSALYMEWPAKRGKDLEALAAREALVTLEAFQRNKKMVDDLKADCEKMRETWEKAYKAYTDGEEALGDKVQTLLKYPAVYSGPESQVKYEAPYMGDRRIPEEVLKVGEPLRMYKRDIEKDAPVAAGIQSEHRANAKKLRDAYDALKNEFESIVQKDYREYYGGGYGDPESWTAMMHVTWMVAGPLEPLQALRDEGAPVVTVYIGDRPWERLKDEVDVATGYQAGLRWISEEITKLEELEGPAALAARFWRLLDAPELRKYEAEDLRRVDIERTAHMKDGKWSASVKPEESDAAAYIAEMKKAWEARKDQIEAAQKIHGTYAALGKSFFGTADPTTSRLFDEYVKIPVRLAEFEKQLATEIAKFKTSRVATKNNLKVMQERFENFKREVQYALPSTPLLQKLEAYQRETVSMRKNTEILVPDALQDIEGMKMIETEVDGMIENCKKIMQAGPPGGSSLGGAGGGGGVTGGLSGSGQGGATGGGVGAVDMDPVMSGFYQLTDVRLNTRRLDSASGEVVITNSDLVAGAVEITARLSSTDRIEKLLVSEDDGRTWNEIPLNANISYRFYPVPDKLYQLVLRIRTNDGQEAMLPFFPNLFGIIHQPIKYEDLVVATTKKLAEAYETQDLGKFERLIARDFIGDRVFLAEGVRYDFDMFMNIRLMIFVNRIEVRGNTYIADTKWDKTQTPRQTGQDQKTTGRTTMIFVLEDGEMKIQNLRGNLIYATLSPQIAESSGLSQTVVEEIRVAEVERIPVQPGAGETQDSGGASSSQIETGTFSLVQTDMMAAADGWIQEYDFTAKRVNPLGAGVLGPVYDFRRNFNGNELQVNASNGIVDMGGVGIDTVTEVPLSGYTTSVGALEGNTYAIKLADGTYALVQSTSWAGALGETTNFRYRHQKDGTRTFA
ncbi:MAG: hypothetical protein WC352_03205 [Candidatus Omnitrophota bacterium]